MENAAGEAVDVEVYKEPVGGALSEAKATALDGLNVGLATAGGGGSGKLFEQVAGKVAAAEVVQEGKALANAGRTANKLKSEVGAEGHHSTFARDNNSNIYKYETYQKTSSGHFNPRKRFDGGKPDGSAGAPHNGISTPHVNGKTIPQDARPPKTYELPRNDRFQ